MWTFLYYFCYYFTTVTIKIENFVSEKVKMKKVRTTAWY